ncbi:MAG TPA: ABC transporter permease, partial [Clostridia bacterium]|nr:ABC transporter permease [Clostridia bacterium]
MRYALKRLYRTPVKTIIFILLISLSASALSISAGMWKYSYDSIKHSKDAFTTIGILRELEFTEQIYKNSVKPKYDYELLGKVKEAAAGLQYTRYTDNREYLMGYSPNVTSSVINGNYDSSYPYAYSIVTGVCESVGYSNYANYSAIIKIDKEDLNILPYFVENSNYSDTEYIDIQGHYLTSDLDFPFKAGEKYIIYAYINGYDYEYKRWVGYLDYKKTEYSEYSERYVLSDKEKTEHPEFNRDSVQCILDDSMLSCHILSTDAKSFLDSGNERWKEIVNNCRITKHSTEILLTDDMYSIYSFNIGDVFILRGRAIRKDEYEQGAKVCVINATVASISGFSIGDKIKLSVYESDFIEDYKMIRSGSVGEAAGENDTEDFFTPLGYEGQGFINEIEYEIVGVYRLPPSAERGELLLSSNVMIVPSKSIEGDFNTKPVEAEVVRDVDGTIQRFKMERTSIPG